jgi:RNA polymerase sigma-70 factor (ECF subfamily)
MSALAVAEPAELERARPEEPGLSATDPGPEPSLDPGLDLTAGVDPDTAGADGGADPPLLESLLRAAVGGEARARERLLAEIHPLVLRYCRARLGRQETVIGAADDVAQEVCLAVVNALPGYTLRGLSFRAFVYGIAAHKVTDAFRAIGRNRAEPMADLPDSPLVHDGPEHHLLQAELTERLGVLLGQLTPRQRDVLILRIAVGLSADETALAVGSTPGAVRVTQHRALNRLRRKIMNAGRDAEFDGEDDDADEIGDSE